MLDNVNSFFLFQREEFHIWEDEDSYPVEAGLRWVLTSGFDIKHGLMQIGDVYMVAVNVFLIMNQCSSKMFFIKTVDTIPNSCLAVGNPTIFGGEFYSQSIT